MIKITLGKEEYYSTNKASLELRLLYRDKQIDRHEMKDNTLHIFNGDRSGTMGPCANKEGLRVFSEISLRNWE